MSKSQNAKSQNSLAAVLGGGDTAESILSPRRRGRRWEHLEIVRHLLFYHYPYLFIKRLGNYIIILFCVISSFTSISVIKGFKVTQSAAGIRVYDYATHIWAHGNQLDALIEWQHG